MKRSHGSPRGPGECPVLGLFGLDIPQGPSENHGTLAHFQPFAKIFQTCLNLAKCDFLGTVSSGECDFPGNMLPWEMWFPGKCGFPGNVTFPQNWYPRKYDFPGNATSWKLGLPGNLGNMISQKMWIPGKWDSPGNLTSQEIWLLVAELGRLARNCPLVGNFGRLALEHPLVPT